MAFISLRLILVRLVTGFISFWLAMSCFSASAVETLFTLRTWQPTENHPVYIIPARASEHPNDAFRHYLRAVARDSALAKEVPINRWREEHGVGSVLNQLEFADPNRSVLLVANRMEDHLRDTPRLNLFIPRNQQFGLRSFVLPVGATARFTREERKAIHVLLGNYFGTVTFLGGRDIAPAIDGRTDPRWSYNYNFTADLLESQIIYDLYHFTESRIMGICRGTQMIGATLGCQINPDVNIVTGVKEIHTGGTLHPVKLLPTRSGVGELVFGKMHDWFRSDHHQSLIVPPKSIFDIAAVSPEGVTEAIVSHDGRVIGVQAHPERKDPFNNGERFFKNYCEQILRLR
jgi:gamma-glutamyl-gamma-aminobutyrate hydrolase PuuD